VGPLVTLPQGWNIGGHGEKKDRHPVANAGGVKNSGTSPTAGYDNRKQSRNQEGQRKERSREGTRLREFAGNLLKHQYSQDEEGKLSWFLALCMKRVGETLSKGGSNRRKGEERIKCDIL